MKRTRRLDILFSCLSWLIVASLVYAAIFVYINPPVSGGPVVDAFGTSVAQTFYLVLYGGEAVALFIAKLFKAKKFRKHVLMVIYLTGFFTSLLSILIIGFIPQVLDNLLIALAAGGCWLYWKHKTEYVHEILD